MNDYFEIPTTYGYMLVSSSYATKVTLEADSIQILYKDDSKDEIEFADSKHAYRQYMEIARVLKAT